MNEGKNLSFLGSEAIVLMNLKLVFYCEHDKVPVNGLAHLAYVPDQKIVSLGSLERVVAAYNLAMQIQERLTVQILQDLIGLTQATGAAVLIEAQHECMKQNQAIVQTFLAHGTLNNDLKKQELWERLRARKKISS